MRQGDLLIVSGWCTFRLNAEKVPTIFSLELHEASDDLVNIPAAVLNAPETIRVHVWGVTQRVAWARMKAVVKYAGHLDDFWAI